MRLRSLALGATLVLAATPHDAGACGGFFPRSAKGRNVKVEVLEVKRVGSFTALVLAASDAADWRGRGDARGEGAPRGGARVLSAGAAAESAPARVRGVEADDRPEGEVSEVAQAGSDVPDGEEMACVAERFKGIWVGKPDAAPAMASVPIVMSPGE